MKIDPTVVLIALVAVNALATLALLLSGKPGSANRRKAPVRAPVPEPATCDSDRPGGDLPAMAQAERRLAMDIERWRSRNPGGDVLPGAAGSCRPPGDDADAEAFVAALQQAPIGTTRQWHGN